MRIHLSCPSEFHGLPKPATQLRAFPFDWIEIKYIYDSIPTPHPVLITTRFFFGSIMANVMLVSIPIVTEAPYSFPLENPAFPWSEMDLLEVKKQKCCHPFWFLRACFLLEDCLQSTSNCTTSFALHRNVSSIFPFLLYLVFTICILSFPRGNMHACFPD